MLRAFGSSRLGSCSIVIESVRGESCLLTYWTTPVKKACNDDNSGVRGINLGVVPSISPGNWLSELIPLQNYQYTYGCMQMQIENMTSRTDRYFRPKIQE
jgi:hypothetical protein